MNTDVPALAPEQIEAAIALARAWQRAAAALQTPAERRQQEELDRLLQTPEDKATLIQLTDQAFRTRSSRRTVDQFNHILEVQGIPHFFRPVEKLLLHGLKTFGGWLPSLSAPLVRRHLRHESANVVLPAERELLTEHLRDRTAAGLRMNVNFLGEALLGEAEARRRLAGYHEALRLPELEVLSVKISTLYSQISPLARRATLRTLESRLAPLYREAAHQRFTRRDGSTVPKFIYLDMEEYRDMSLTAEAFRRTLDLPGLEQVRAGIALQAYLPDSLSVLRELTKWAQERVARGGAPITVRLVKGANLEMERVDAALHGWPQAPYHTKAETDASYVRLLHEALQPARLGAVHIGVASHNLFDVALGAVLAGPAAARGEVQFEMLEGMANHQRRALAAASQPLLLYAPACRHEDFINAIGYLVRRLDENTGPDNFLRHAFRLHVEGDEWRRLEEQFRASCATAPSTAPRRTQDRSQPPSQPPDVFRNEPDTDFSLPHHARWAKEILARWQPRCGTLAPEVPAVIAGVECRPRERAVETEDPSRPGVVTCRHWPAGAPEIEDALACAVADPAGWRALRPKDRSATLRQVAQELRVARAELIGAALANTGKTIGEGDPEVSEAIDFVEFYRRSAEEWFALPEAEARPAGVVVVAPPWNFPIAIPCGGVAAALAAGNTVILKPATPAVLVAWELCQCFWRAGIDRRTLQFVPCPGAGMAERLVTDPRVAQVILTGGTSTALHLLQQRPDLPLSAETGGKNVTIVTAMADREQAIKHVLHSAFSHSGQKCSATSLLLLEGEVYDDPHFRELLIDAAQSLAVGSAWDLATKVGPLIHPPGSDLARGLLELEPGEEWALQPEQKDGHPNLWSPGIKYGVERGSFTHRTELFGPVLGVMRFDHLQEALEIIRETGYGLTSGLESLDDREQQLWQSGVTAGNLYLNKPTVGAVVRRQPFGGLAKSAVGPAMKAGGPNYLAQLLQFHDREPAEWSPAIALPDWAKQWQGTDTPEFQHAAGSYQRARDEEFSRALDESLILGEDNFRRYVPLPLIRVRVSSTDSRFSVLARVFAARLARCAVILSVENDPSPWEELVGDGITLCQENDEVLADLLRHEDAGRLRYAGPRCVPAIIRRAAAQGGTYIADRPVSSSGRLELLSYLQEQSLSHAYHRYGNLGGRAGEQRTQPA